MFHFTENRGDRQFNYSRKRQRDICPIFRAENGHKTLVMDFIGDAQTATDIAARLNMDDLSRPSSIGRAALS